MKKIQNRSTNEFRSKCQQIWISNSKNIFLLFYNFHVISVENYEDSRNSAQDPAMFIKIEPMLTPIKLFLRFDCNARWSNNDQNL